MLGKLIQRFFGGHAVASIPAQHSLTLTPRAAAMIRQIIAEQQLIATSTSVVAGLDGTGWHKLDLTEELTVRSSPENVMAVSEGLIVVLPRQLVGTYERAQVDFIHGGFKFDGPYLQSFAASDPGGMTASRAVLQQYAPAIADNPIAFDGVNGHLLVGDCNAAVIVSLEPLVVAAYASDLDDVALLQFPSSLAAGRKVGDQLLTVNTFMRGPDTAPDLVRGPGATTHFWNFTPIIADFFAAEPEIVAQRKTELFANLWTIARERATAALARAAGRFRNGIPPHSADPAYDRP
jgi:hypothetical protein